MIDITTTDIIVVIKNFAKRDTLNIVKDNKRINIIKNGVKYRITLWEKKKRLSLFLGTHNLILDNIIGKVP